MSTFLKDSHQPPVSQWSGYLGGTFGQLQQTTTSNGNSFNFNCWANPFVIFNIDNGDNTDVVHVYLPNPIQSGLPPMTAFIILRNSTDYQRTVSFHPASGQTINEGVADASYDIVLDAYPSGIDDHNLRHCLVIGNKKTGKTHIGVIQANPHDAVTLDLDEAATGADIISDGVGPNLALKGIVSGGTSIDTATNPVVRLTVNVVGSDIVLDLEEVV